MVPPGFVIWPAATRHPLVVSTATSITALPGTVRAPSRPPRLGPFEVAGHRDEGPAALEGGSKRGLHCHGLYTGVDGGVADLRVLGPEGHQAPAQALQHQPGQVDDDCGALRGRQVVPAAPRPGRTTARRPPRGRPGGLAPAARSGAGRSVRTWPNGSRGASSRWHTYKAGYSGSTIASLTPQNALALSGPHTMDVSTFLQMTDPCLPSIA